MPGKVREHQGSGRRPLSGFQSLSAERPQAISDHLQGPVNRLAIEGLPLFQGQADQIAGIIGNFTENLTKRTDPPTALDSFPQQEGRPGSATGSFEKKRGEITGNTMAIEDLEKRIASQRPQQPALATGNNRLQKSGRAV